MGTKGILQFVSDLVGMRWTLGHAFLALDIPRPHAGCAYWYRSVGLAMLARVRVTFWVGVSGLGPEASETLTVKKDASGHHGAFNLGSLPGSGISNSTALRSCGCLA